MVNLALLSGIEPLYASDRQVRRKPFQSKLVPVEGFEPPRIAAADFESAASTNSAIRANRFADVIVPLYICLAMNAIPYVSVVHEATLS